MLILGSGGFAMQLLDVLSENEQFDLNSLSFLNNTGRISSAYIHAHFNIVSDEQAYCAAHSEVQFLLGIGNPAHRKALFKLLSSIDNAKAAQLISKHAVVSKVNVQLAEAVTIMTGAVVMGNVSIGTGALINCNSSIGHDSVLGEFVEVCPGVVMAGNCCIGDETFIGSGAVIFPGIAIGKGCVIGAGAIVTKDVHDRHKVIGNPGVSTQL